MDQANHMMLTNRTAATPRLPHVAKMNMPCSGFTGDISAALQQLDHTWMRLHGSDAILGKDSGAGFGAREKPQSRW